MLLMGRPGGLAFEASTEVMCSAAHVLCFGEDTAPGADAW